MRPPGPPSRTSRAPGILLGAGLGGFVDGIVLHQVLQWHNMLSSVDPPSTMAAMRRNMRADGLFHAATWVFTLIGVLALWRATRRGTDPPTMTALAGDLLLGWGLFNLIEGLVDHQVLGMHHVREVGQYLAYDLGFLLLGGLGLIVLGGWLGRRGREAAPRG